MVTSPCGISGPFDVIVTGDVIFQYFDAISSDVMQYRKEAIGSGDVTIQKYSQ